MNPEEQSSSQNSMPERRLVVPSRTVHPSLVLSGFFNFKCMPTDQLFFNHEQESDFSQWIMSGYGDDRLLLAVDWIKRVLNPEDIFSTTQLDQWAESEGYVKQTENE